MRELVELYIETAIRLSKITNKQSVFCDVKEDIAPMNKELSNHLDYYKKKYCFSEINNRYNGSCYKVIGDRLEY